MLTNEPIIKASFDILYDPLSKMIVNIALRKDIDTPLIYMEYSQITIVSYIVNNFILSLSMLLDKQLPYTKDCYSFNNPLLMNLNAFYTKILEFLVTNTLLIKNPFLFSYIGRDLSGTLEITNNS